MIHHELSNPVLSAILRVHTALGPGLLESAYEGATAIDLANQGIPFQRQKRYEVRYLDRVAGDYYADLVVADAIILGLKAVKELTSLMQAQLLNYLRISGLRVGYLVNFAAESAVWRRYVK